MPGVANVHSHAFQRAMAGLAERRGPEDDNFWTWREVMYRFLAAMTPDDIEAVAALAYVEMLEAGFTTVGEFHYLHNAPDGTHYADPAETGGRIVAAAEGSGIGLALLPSLLCARRLRRTAAHAGTGAIPLRSRRFLAAAGGEPPPRRPPPRRHPRHRAAFAARRRCARAAALVERWTAGPMHIHAAEQAREVEECLAWSGARPVQWLLDNANVDARWCLIHCTHMTDDESRRLAQSGAVAGLCPITEANLGDGIFERRAMPPPAGASPSARTATCASPSTRKCARWSTASACVSGSATGSGRTAPRPAGTCSTRHAAAARRRWGRLRDARGRQTADIVMLDNAHPALGGRRGDFILDSWMFAGGEGVVREVFAAGKHVVAEGRHVRGDEILRRFTATMRRLQEDA